MSFHLFISRISFEYDGAVEPLFDELSLSFPGGFTGVVGANGCGKSTLLKLLTGLLTPDRGTVSASGPAVFCMQEVFEPPDGPQDLGGGIAGTVVQTDNFKIGKCLRR